MGDTYACVGDAVFHSATPLLRRENMLKSYQPRFPLIDIMISAYPCNSMTMPTYCVRKCNVLKRSMLSANPFQVF